MRTKTLALSALLGLLGSASVMAQNVYSINTVGYINVTFPAGTYTILTCPLIAGVDANGVTNSLNVVLPNTNGQYKHAQVYQFTGGSYSAIEGGVGVGADPSGWSGGGSDVTLLPGQAVFFYNSTINPMSATFVGTVPQSNNYNLTNALIPGYNLVGSIIPATGDLSTNPILLLTNIYKKDFVDLYDQSAGYSQYGIVGPGNGSGYSSATGQWSVADPIITNAAFGFFYYNNNTGGSGTNYWVENFTINP
jgi:hypothetical protein